LKTKKTENLIESFESLVESLAESLTEILIYQSNLNNYLKENNYRQSQKRSNGK